jgi:hypothetical protein
MRLPLFIILTFSLFTISIFAQLSVKDQETSPNTLLQVNDEGAAGSITLPSLSSIGDYGSKLYNYDGTLHWNGNELATGSGFSLPYFGETTSTEYVFHLVNLGEGGVCKLELFDATSTNHALRAESYADFATTYSYNFGEGPAGEFEIANSSSSSFVLQAKTNGSGNSVAGYNTGTGTSGYFQINNTSNSESAIFGYTNGIGKVLDLDHAGTSGDIAILRSSGVPQARIDKTGKGFFNGGTQSSGADIAEAFDVEGTVTEYESGDVIIISTSSNRKVEKSSEAYSKLVIGVYATKPGVLLTEHNINENIDKTIPVGIIGVIPTKVCSENGPISRGDLLVSSSRIGHAMRGTKNDMMFGAIIGKALEPFTEDGFGKIDVLVNTK